MGKGWTHSICFDCWIEKNPDRQPIRIKQEFAEQETCCFCGEKTSDGIYFRESPNNVDFCEHEV